VREATTDPEQIAQWWTEHPDANIAVAMGAPSGVWCLDVDGEEGEEALAGLAKKYGHTGRVEAAVEQLTSRGRHLIFTHPGEPVPNKVALAPKLDVRGDGGYICVAPSNHVSGKEYTWEVSSHPLDHKPEQAPEWLLRVVMARREREAPDGTPRSPTMAGVQVIEGGRNDALFRLGCALRTRGFSEAGILAAITAENVERCVPPLDDDEVAACAASAARYEPGALDAPGGESDPTEAAPVDDVEKAGGQPVTDFAVLEVVRQSSEPPMYRLRIRPFVNGTTRSSDESIQWLHLDQEQYCEKRKFLRAFHARFAREPKVPTKTEGWRNLRNRWDARARIERVPAEVSARESLMREIRHVVEALSIGETAEDLQRGQIIEKAGEYFVNLPAVRERMDRRSRTVSDQALAARFRDLGLIPAGGTRAGVVNIRGRAVSAWVLPDDLRPQVVDETVDG